MSEPVAYQRTGGHNPTKKERATNLLVDRYKEELRELFVNHPKQKSITVNYKIMEEYDHDLADILTKTPYVLYEIFRKVIWDLQGQLSYTEEKIPEDKMYVRFEDYNGIVLESLKDLGADVIGQYVTFNGLVKRKSPKMPRLNNAQFECRSCCRLVTVPQSSSSIVEPGMCMECGAKQFKLLENESTHIDTQMIWVQDPLENLVGRETPEIMDVLVEDDLVNSVMPGELLQLSGVLKVVKKEGNKHISKYQFACNHIKILEKEYEDIVLEPEDIEQIIELSQNENIFEMLSKSLAPSIYGMEKVKESVTLQLFSGTEKILDDGTRKRPDIHILLMGDPGVAKSQLLRIVSNQAPGGINTNGKGSTAAGLTAAAVRDDFGGGGWTLEAGATVLADRGHVCCDEFDKMRSEDRSAMHEVMEQQTVSIAKAGITATLNTRCSILAAANPKYGRFDPDKSIGEQIDLTATILSRFDVIFILEDKPSEENDMKIGQHMLDIHESDAIIYDIGNDLFKKYIAYARQNFHPRIGPEANQKILEFYVGIRKKVEPGDPVPFTARQLEGLVRLTEASAKAHLRDVANEDDANRAIGIIMDYLYKVGMDAETGKLDADKLAGMKGKSYNEKLQKTMILVDQMREEYGGRLPSMNLVVEEIASKVNVTDDMALDLINESNKQLKKEQTLV